MSRLFTQSFIHVQIKENNKLRVTGLCEGNAPVTGEFPAQRASNAENVSIGWRHHAIVTSTDPKPAENRDGNGKLVRVDRLIWHCQLVASIYHIFNTLRLRQNGRHFADDVFKCIFLNENVWISLKISLRFVSKVPIDNIPALVQIMAWRRSGDKPLSEPMMVSLLTHICNTRPQWVNGSTRFCKWSVKYVPLWTM